MSCLGGDGGRTPPQLVSELSGIDETMVKLLVDNNSAIVLTKNPVQHSRTKHINTRHHFMRQYVEDKKIQVDYVRTKDQLADILTKSLGRVKFLEMREHLGIVKVCMEELSKEENVELSQLCMAFCPAVLLSFLEENVQALYQPALPVLGITCNPLSSCANDCPI